MLKTMNVGIDHGYYAIKTRHFSFLAGIAVYSHEPYTLQNTLEYGVPNASTCRSLELGMIRCIDETKEQVRRDVGVSVTDAQVERVLAGKPCSMDEMARSIIRRQGRLYTERFLSAVMESGFDLKAIPVVMLGGGASVVKGNVSPQDGLCRVFALTDDRVNAEGFERILGQFSGGLSRG